MLTPRSLRSFDGTEVAYYEGGRPDGVPLILSNGLGAAWMIWQPLIERFRSKFRILTWDYRGLYGSAAATGPSDYALDCHTGDLIALLEEEEVEDPVLVGWSMGVQVGLELHRSHPERLRGLIALHGTPGQPLQTAFDSALPASVAPWIFSAMRGAGRNLAGIGSLLAEQRGVSDAFVSLGRQLGMMSDSLDLERFHEIAKQWVRLDLAAYAEVFQQLGVHDASDLLGSVKTPTLVITGGADRLTPPALGERMAAAMPDAEVHHVPGATHFGLLEYPDEIVGAIETYLRVRLGIAED